MRLDAPGSLSFLKLAGPGLVVAATGIGSGDVVAATVGGARYGVILLWAIAIGAFFKYVLNEGIARWQLATGKTALEGWAEYLPAWVKCVLRRVSRALDGRRHRRADERDRPRHQQPDRQGGFRSPGAACCTACSASSSCCSADTAGSRS